MAVEQRSPRGSGEDGSVRTRRNRTARVIDPDLERALERYHLAADEFARGNPEPVKVLFSHGHDVTIANPFVGLPAHGWADVSRALDYASSRFRDGEPIRFQTIERYVGADLATILELEEWRTRVAERDEVSPFVLRVTSTFRREDGAWRLAHRHADPIATPNPDGPLRAS